MGSSSSAHVRPMEPAQPPGFICRIEQTYIEAGHYNYRLKYRPELPAPLQSSIHPQLWNLFIQKLDNAFETGPVEPWLGLDSEWYRVNNTRREIAQNVCNGANQNIFFPAGMRAVAQYRIVKHNENGKSKLRWIHVVDICSNSTTVVTQHLVPSPQPITTPPAYQAAVAQTVPVAAPVDSPSPPPPYQPTQAQSQAQASPAYASPTPVYAAQAYQPPYASPPGGFPVSPPASYAYPAQAYQHQQPYPAQPYQQQQQSSYPGQAYAQQQQSYQQQPIISTHVITTHHVIPQIHTPAYQSSGNSSADHIPLQTQ